MSTTQHYFGIDFGATYSSMVWYDTNKAEAKILLNDHDEAKTPSLVFFGDDEIRADLVSPVDTTKVLQHTLGR